MNFFEHQAAARRTSTRLVVLFALAVLGIVLAVDLAVLVAFGGGAGGAGALIAFATLATLGVIGLGSLYRIASLRGGGEPVALQFGGVPVPGGHHRLQLRRLRNVVEEIAIASGVPVPKIYVLEHEAAINAFAAGYSPSDAVVAVTRGALDKLNRDELQGVIAHEFSHILNGDMRLNIRLIGVLFGILMLGLIGRKILQYGARRAARTARRDAGRGADRDDRRLHRPVLRPHDQGRRQPQRESLADASAVQFTRQTAGLAGALKKIGGVARRLASSTDRGDAEEVSHMLFGDGVGFSGLFATHPPLLERIQALEPQFSGRAAASSCSAQWLAAPPNGLRGGRRAGPGRAAAARRCRRTARSSASRRRWSSRRSRTPAADDYRRADAIVDDAFPTRLRALAARARSGDAAAARPAARRRRRRIAAAAHRDRRAPRRTGRGRRAGAARADRWPRCIRCCGCRWRRWPSRCCACARGRSSTRSSTPSMPWSMPTARCRCSSTAWAGCCRCRCANRSIPSRHARFGRRKPGNVRQEFATLLAVVAQCRPRRRRRGAARLPCRPAARAAARSPALCAAGRTACWRWTKSGSRSTRWIRWPSR